MWDVACLNMYEASLSQENVSNEGKKLNNTVPANHDSSLPTSQLLSIILLVYLEILGFQVFTYILSCEIKLLQSTKIAMPREKI